MRVVPLTLKQANDLVALMHRHHKPAQGHRFSLGLMDGEQLVGACIVGRPLARNTGQYDIAEITRLVTDGTPNACSMLYGAAARAAKAMGFRQIQTFILGTESGTSLRASGWVLDGTTEGGSWNRQGRERVDNHPLTDKQRWVRVL